MLAYLSSGQSIQPGHVLSAGCYHKGCGFDLGRRWLPGDLIELRVSGIGALVCIIGA
jgi:2-keto-4-pentenoate hydratase/2-oxohepta-3-ene-1,7-dioic acid hydratase in catechol pathway